MSQEAEYHCKLSSLYLEACYDEVAPAREDLVVRMQDLGQQIASTGNASLRQAYMRHARLLSLVLKDHQFSEKVALAELLGPISASGEPGISVVTCSMNRTENLLLALPSWLRHPEVSEVVIVDWSSDEPVRNTLAAHGFSDQRIRVVRVNGAPRWILSCAFNAGFRAATFDTILKVDADIVISEDFFSRNGVPAKDSFVAGNWRMAGEGQTHVNGFFFTSRAALAGVGGFSEFITTYGWDDDDLYARLESAGIQRHDVAPDTIYHLPHSDDERTGEANDDTRPASEAIMATPRFKIQRNRVLADMMSPWSAEMEPLALVVEARREDGMDLSIAGKLDQTVPAEVFDRASRDMLQEDPSRPDLWIASAYKNRHMGNWQRARQLLRRVCASQFPERAEAQEILSTWIDEEIAA